MSSLGLPRVPRVPVDPRRRITQPQPARTEVGATWAFLLESALSCLNSVVYVCVCLRQRDVAPQHHRLDAQPQQQQQVFIFCYVWSFVAAATRA